jgi:predicted 2-oxoglutarate/Fe(II)-dependent dioxygenase YbiX
MSEVATDIWTIPAFLSSESCSMLVARAEAAGFEAATINKLGGAVREEAARNNDRVIFDDHALAYDLWQRLKSQVPAFVAGRQAIGLNERFRVYRYAPGQQFKGHIDGTFARANGEISQLTCMIYLNDGFSGGETAFSSIVVKPTSGLALIFHHNLFHEGRSVADGLKYVLRSDVMFNPVGKVSG